MSKYPGLGAKCNGCGLCCLHAPCPLAQKYELWTTSGCRALKRDGERYQCEAVAAPAKFGVAEVGLALEALVLGIGLGCSFRAAWSAEGVRAVLKRAPVIGAFNDGRGGTSLRRLRSDPHGKTWPRIAVYYQPDGSALNVTQQSPTAEPAVGGVPLSQFKERRPMKMPTWAVGLLALAATLLVGLVFTSSAHAAITQTGSCTTVGSTSTYGAASGTIASITVPADATLMTIGVSAFHGTNGVTSANGTFDIGGNTSVGVGGSASTNWGGPLHYILSPATGTQNLDWQWGGGAGVALDDATVIISYCFWLGVDTGSPTRDSDAAQGSGANTTTPSLTAQSGDLIIAWASSFDGASANLTYTWTDATKLIDVTNTDYADGSYATSSPTGNQTVTGGATGRDEGAVSAFVFKAAAGGGGGSVVPHILQQSAANDADYERRLVANSR